jgi:hypothetical protein
LKRIGIHDGEQGFSQEKDHLAIERAGIEPSALDERSVQVFGQADGERYATGHDTIMASS